MAGGRKEKVSTTLAADGILYPKIFIGCAEWDDARKQDSTVREYIIRAESEEEALKKHK